MSPFSVLDAITRLQLQIELIGIWQEMRNTRLLARLPVGLPRPRDVNMLSSCERMAVKSTLMNLLLWVSRRAAMVAEPWLIVLNALPKMALAPAIRRKPPC